MTITYINERDYFSRFKRRRNTQLIWMTRVDFIRQNRRRYFGIDYDRYLLLVEVRYDPS